MVIIMEVVVELILSVVVVATDVVNVVVVLFSSPLLARFFGIFAKA